MRTLTALGAAWLYFASLQAPFAHFHPEDPDHHHATGFVHMHVGHALEHPHATPEEPEWADHDDDETAISQEWAPTAATRVQIAYTEVAVAFVFSPGVMRAGVAPEFTVRSHDPPGQRLYPPRAPPV